MTFIGHGAIFRERFRVASTGKPWRSFCRFFAFHPRRMASSQVIARATKRQCPSAFCEVAGRARGLPTAKLPGVFREMTTFRLLAGRRWSEKRRACRSRRASKSGPFRLKIFLEILKNQSLRAETFLDGTPAADLLARPGPHGSPAWGGIDPKRLRRIA
jgi:hypothetical protein